MLTLFPSLSATFAEIQRITKDGFTETAVGQLCNIAWEGGGLTVPSDPFGPAYREFVVDVWKQISLRPAYQPEIHEKCPMDIAAKADQPSVYVTSTSASLGNSLAGTGAILKALELSPGQRLLEYGAGEGQIALHLARMGVDVSVIDIEPSYLEVIRLQAARNNLKVRTKQGSFLDDYGSERFDCVMFFEAFHHALDHIEVMQRLRDVTPKVVLAVEPIQAIGDYWRDTIPFPWGPRLDGLSLNAMRVHGWMELGFRSEYIEDLAVRTGWKLQHIPSPASALGHCWVFTRA
jgi:SAM-dependent methyltransferase